MLLDKIWYVSYNNTIYLREDMKSMASLSLKNIHKAYDNGFVAVRDFNLEI